jgi:hypothetical protein
MSESTGPNARRAIEAANRRRGAFVVGPRGPRTATEAATKRSDFLKAQRAKAPLRETPPRETTPTPPTTPVPPADPAAPKKDVFDDLFKKE